MIKEYKKINISIQILSFCTGVLLYTRVKKTQEWRAIRFLLRWNRLSLLWNTKKYMYTCDNVLTLAICNFKGL